jgi:hypothetical protein
MTYYADLTPYSYLPEAVPEGTTVLNIGWLDGEHPFPTGQPPERFAERLGVLCAEHPVVRTRGAHWCELCTEEEADYPVVEDVDGTAVALGSAEIRVADPAGVVLAAPDLVYHYVIKHGYLPPEPFIEAVLALRAVAEPIEP